MFFFIGVFPKETINNHVIDHYSAEKAAEKLEQDRRRFLEQRKIKEEVPAARTTEPSPQNNDASARQENSE